MIAIPSESSQEKRVVQRIGEEMENVGFDRVEIDPMGNVLGYIGKGKHLIAIDAHIDTVGIGDRRLWDFDPYEGFEDEEYVGGRGASDQKGGMASAVYAGKIIKDLDLEGDYTLVVTGIRSSEGYIRCRVQEEDCDGLCWQYIINEDNLRPEFVVSTEPTGCRIYRGHRGRMEIKVTTRGMSCHGSAPYAIADLMTMQEKRGGLRKAKVSVIWAYATSRKKPISVPLSQVLLFPRYGMNVPLAYPEGYDLPDWAIKQARDNAEESGGSLTITHDMEEAYRDVDVVIRKNWGSWVANQGTTAKAVMSLTIGGK